MLKRQRKDENESKTMKNNKHWALGLLHSMNEPNLQVYSDNLIIIIKDKYPKAKYHYLVLPKENISNLKELNKEHLKLLEHIENEANNLIKDDEHKEFSFRFGYHAEASMHQLHMHVISDDMVSKYLKTKKHWNSFTTDFFIQSKVIRDSIAKNDKVELPSPEKCKEYINATLKCHKCNFQSKNMPALKEHIKCHIKKN